VKHFSVKSSVGAGLHKRWVPGSPGSYILYGGVYYLWVPTMEFASCHASGA